MIAIRPRFVVAAVIAVVLVIGMAISSGSASNGGATAAYEEYRKQARMDSAGVVSQRSVANAALTRERTVAARRRNQRAHTDSLAARADADLSAVGASSSPADSLTAWATAYASRVEELRAVEATVILADSATALADARAQALDSALVLSERRAERADSVLVVTMGRQKECRMLRLLPCPSRRTVAGVAIVTAVLLRR